MDAPSLAAITEEAVARSPSVWAMVSIGTVMALTFGAIAFEVFHKSLAALLGAIIAVALALSMGVYPAGYAAIHDYIGHDLAVIGVIVGTSILVEIAGSSGLFHFVAIKLVKLTGGRPRSLLPMLMLATVGFVTFLTITPAVLIMASLVLVITEALDENPTPYMMGVAIAANSGALMTFASGIPTLMIGTSAGIPYVHFLIVSAPLAIVSALLAYAVVRFSYRRALVSHPDQDAARAAKVAAFDQWALVKDRRLFHRAAGILALTILGFALAQQIGVGLDFIAMCGAAGALLFSGFDPEEAIRKVKWPVILFFVGLFVLIGTVRATGLLELIAIALSDFAGPNILLAMVILIPFVFIASGIVDNIPVAATMIPIVRSMIARGLPAEPLWWSLIAGTNLGGNLTPVGSIAGVITLHALEKERGIRVGWGHFLRVGGTTALLQIVLVIAWMDMYRRLGWFPSLAGGTP